MGQLDDNPDVAYLILKYGSLGKASAAYRAYRGASEDPAVTMSDADATIYVNVFMGFLPDISDDD